MRVGICAPHQKIAELHAIPFDYLEEDVQRFLAPEADQEGFEENLRGARLLHIPVEAANNLLPADMVLVETDRQQVDRTRLERYIRTALRRAERAGIRVIVFGSGRARACPPGHERGDAVRQIGEHLARWSVWAGDHGVELALEPLRYEETNVLNTVAEAGALVESIAGAGLLVDLYHMASNGEPPESILPWTPLICHVHVAERAERTAPGRHGDDFRPYFAALRGNREARREAGAAEAAVEPYDRRISIECGWLDLAAEVETAIETVREQWRVANNAYNQELEGDRGDG